MSLFVAVAIITIIFLGLLIFLTTSSLLWEKIVQLFLKSNKRLEEEKLSSQQPPKEKCSLQDLLTLEKLEEGHHLPEITRGFSDAGSFETSRDAQSLKADNEFPSGSPVLSPIKHDAELLQAMAFLKQKKAPRSKNIETREVHMQFGECSTSGQSRDPNPNSSECTSSPQSPVVFPMQLQRTFDPPQSPALPSSPPRSPDSKSKHDPAVVDILNRLGWIEPSWVKPLKYYISSEERC